MKTTLFTLIAAATLAAGGVAVAQTTAPAPGQAITSTPGNGCTATANAMRGGNLSTSPSAINCAQPGQASTAAAPVPATAGTSMGAAPTTSAAPEAPAAPVRAARADRN